MSNAKRTLRADRLLQELATRAAFAGEVEGCACLFNALLYLAGRAHYRRLSLVPEDIFLDHWLRDAVRSRRMETIRVRWTEQEILTVRAMYRDTPTREIAKLLARPVGAVHWRAQKLGIAKSAELIAREAAANMARPGHRGRLFQFRPGLVPVNKGVRRPGWSPGRMALTQFKKGVRPHTWKPVGSWRHDDDGYLQRKVTDTGYPPRDWRPWHHVVWEEANGPIPAGHALVFRDGNKQHIALENLELLTRRELMARNTVHNLPKELVEVIQLTGALKRVIRNKEKKLEEQNVRSA
jgi:hypothetical protein